MYDCSMHLSHLFLLMEQFTPFDVDIVDDVDVDLTTEHHHSTSSTVPVMVQQPGISQLFQEVSVPVYATLKGVRCSSLLITPCVPMATPL